ncbi:MAG: ribosome-associated translation inhibitor RaiA [Nitrospirota bacterium]|nr:ribosome-associated translation inhibitor RaiA [Nitrospirota bacterium]
MEIGLQITSRDIELTDAIRADIEEKAGKLDRYYDRIMRCRVVIETPKRHQHEGKLYDVHIYMTVPGGELVVKRELNKDLYVAIRDSFQAARRKLEDFARQQRLDVKRHEEPPQARITSIFPDKGYGFLTRPDGLEVYFHENSVVNKDFKKLKVGMKVRFAEEMGVKGPQASSVTVI